MPNNPTSTLTLVSHHLCPYVQRAAISLAEKRVPFERLPVDLVRKPDWFIALSPLGKVPLLKVSRGGKQTVIFESSVILEYLEETQPRPLHPADPVDRARHRSWIEFGSAVLAAIARFYSAGTAGELDAAAGNLSQMFARIEVELGSGPWFAGQQFCLVDAAFGPVFRYFDTFDKIDDFGIMEKSPKVREWRSRLARRPSVGNAVDEDYPARLIKFLANRNSALSGLIADQVAA
ncbi:MAG: glutathione S-transferase family protein [Aestuariivirgaceae bacterium]